jgi:hypothetical protein
MRRILAFDSSCGGCRQLSDAVARACGDRLDVLPLTHPDVVGWRERALGPDAPFAPTLLEVTEGTVRAWRGRALAARLVRSLGPRTTLDVLRALGRLRAESRGSAAAAAESVSRKRFLRIGAGLAVAGGLVLTGRMPAFAADDAARRWVAANRDRLPHGYDAVIAHPLDYRRAIFQELPPATRGALWTEQLRRYQNEHQDLTPEQKDVLASALAMASSADTYQGNGPDPDELTRFRASAEAAFGADPARRLFATLGPADRSTTQPADQRGCTCATTSDWCDNSTHCFRTNCINQSGCGTLWSSNCDGLCRN